jgi:hypothetical protein
MRFLRNLGIMMAFTLCLFALVALAIWLGEVFKNYPGGHYYGLLLMIVLILVGAAAWLTAIEK